MIMFYPNRVLLILLILAYFSFIDLVNILSRCTVYLRHSIDVFNVFDAERLIELI